MDTRIYAIKRGENGGITIIDDAGFPIVIGHQEMNDLINRAIALHVIVIRTLKKSYISHYKESVVIPSNASFGHGNTIDITLIVRKKHGVIGFRCIGGYLTWENLLKPECQNTLLMKRK